MRILVVEDELTSRIILSKILAPYGNVTLCSNGREAVEAFASALEDGSRFSLVCLDVVMPEMDGPAALKIFRSLEEGHGIMSEQRSKVIMTTALADDEKVLLELKDSYDVILNKPIRRDALLETLMGLGMLHPAWSPDS